MNLFFILNCIILSNIFFHNEWNNRDGNIPRYGTYGRGSSPGNYPGIIMKVGVAAKYYVGSLKRALICTTTQPALPLGFLALQQKALSVRSLAYTFRSKRKRKTANISLDARRRVFLCL